MVLEHLAKLQELTVECDQQLLVDARDVVSDRHREHDGGGPTELSFEGAGHATPHHISSHLSVPR